MALTFRLTQSIHLCFGLPRFLLSGGTISRIFLPTYYWSRLFKWPNHISLAFLHLSVMFSTFSFFTWELVTGTVSISYSIAGWTIILCIFPLTCGGTLLSHLHPVVPSTLRHLVYFCTHVTIALQGASQIFEIGDLWQHQVWIFPSRT